MDEVIDIIKVCPIARRSEEKTGESTIGGYGGTVRTMKRGEEIERESDKMEEIRWDMAGQPGCNGHPFNECILVFNGRHGLQCGLLRTVARLHVTSVKLSRAGLVEGRQTWTGKKPIVGRIRGYFLEAPSAIVGCREDDSAEVLTYTLHAYRT